MNWLGCKECLDLRHENEDLEAHEHNWSHFDIGPLEECFLQKLRSFLFGIEREDE
jgi:hypothetical protein